MAMRRIIGGLVFCFSGAVAGAAQSADPATAVHHVEVSVPTPDPSIVLAGTLSLPSAAEGHVLVVFLTGSGDHTRDGVISGTPMLRDIGDALLAAGYATLRLDDRGTGKSTGPTTTASTTADRVTDMRAVVDWLFGSRVTDPEAVILLGFSEGASVAAAVAAAEPRVNGLMLLGAPALSGSTVWIDQQLAGIAAHLGRDRSELGEIRDLLAEVVERSAGGATEALIEEVAVTLFAASDIDLEEAKESGLIDGFVARVASPWFRYFLGHDPIDDYRRVRVPVLAVYGSVDRLTSPALNAGPLTAAMESAGVADFTLEILPDQDHFFMRGDGLAPGEHRYGAMQVAPELLEHLVEWLAPRYPSGAAHSVR